MLRAYPKSFSTLLNNETTSPFAPKAFREESNNFTPAPKQQGSTEPDNQTYQQRNNVPFTHHRRTQPKFHR